MSDVSVADGASAPAAAPALIPIDTAPVDVPSPVRSEPQPVKAAAEPAKSPSIAEALSNAKAKMVAEGKLEAGPRDAAKPVKAEPVAEKADTTRDPTGRFAPRTPVADAQKPVQAATNPAPAAQPQTATPAQPSRYEAPARFSSDAKAAWETAPEPVRAEVHRAIRELEAGHQKYKADAEEFDRVRPFAETAKRNGTDLPGVLERVVAIDDAFKRNPLEGFQKVADHFGIPLRALAAHIMGQTPDQQATQVEATIRELNAKIASLEKQVGGVTQTIETQRKDATTQTVAEFAAMPEHSRFEELADDIAFFLQTRTKDLKEAYTLAERLNPAPATPTPVPAASSADPALEAQTQKASKSVRGAPSAGSTPPRKQPSSSVRESLSRAIAEVGAR